MKRHRYAVVRIDNGIRQPHTGTVKSFASFDAAWNFIDRENRKLKGGAYHPYAVLDRDTGEKTNSRTAWNPSARKTRKRVGTALKKLVRGNPSGKTVRVRNFTGTITRTRGGQVVIQGKGKRS